MQADNAPVVIGGSGGSGTRVFATACMAAGYDLGTHLNEAGDALDFTPFYDHWINPYLRRQQAPLGEEQMRAMREQFQQCFLNFRGRRNTGKWGWKNPRSMLMLPFFDSRFPALKFIHVVRDGRDMAASRNQNQLNKHGEALLGAEYQSLPPYTQSIAFWSAANLAVAKYGEEHMGGRYLCCRFEDMCIDPVTSLARLAEFLEVRVEAVSTVAGTIKTPDTIGRRRTLHAAEQARLLDAGRPGLEYFGYLEE